MSGKSGFVQIDTNREDRVFGNETYYQITLGSFLRKKENTLIFCGISTEASQGVVDTAAQSGLIGEHALSQFSEELRKCGLRYRMTDRKGQARGVGGEAVVKGVVELPIGIAGVNGILEATVVTEDVPLLLPVKLLRDLHAVINLSTGRLELSQYGRVTIMNTMRSGHVTVSIVEFDEEGWRLPDEALRCGLKESDFCLPLEQSSSQWRGGIQLLSQNRSSSFLWCHEPMEPPQQDLGGDGLQEWCLFEQRGGCSSYEGSEGYPKLEEGFGEGHESHRGVRKGGERVAGRARSLARRWISIWLCTCTYGESTSIANVSKAFEQARNLCGVDQDWHSFGSPEDDEATNYLKCDMHPSHSVTMWGGQSVAEGSVVPGMLQPMEDRNYEPTKFQGGSSSVNQEGDECTEYSTKRVKFLEHGEPNEKSSDSNNVDGKFVTSQDGAGGSEMPVPEASSSVHSEEGGPDKGEALLSMQRQDLRLLHVGPGGGSSAQECHGDAWQGQCGGSGDHEGADGVGHDGSEEAGRRHEDEGDGDAGRAQEEGTRDATDACPDERKHQTADRDYDAACRYQAPGTDARSALSVSGADGTTPKPTDVDHGSGWRGEAESGLQRSSAQCGDGSAGYGDEKKCPAISGHDASLRDGEGGLSSMDWKGCKRDLKEDEMKKIKEVAPWVFELQSSNETWGKVRRIQLEESYEPEDCRKFSQCYWQRDGQVWKYHHGILPEEEPGVEREVVLAMEEENGLESEEADQVYGVMSRSSRKRLKKALGKIKISELYSEPRVSAQGERQGCEAGTCFDLKTGYNFNVKADRVRAWKRIKNEDPDLVVVCPPCGPFSVLQEWNYPKMEKEKAMMILGEGLEHLEFSMEIFEWQVRRGKLALFEHPDTSRAWKEECVQRMLRLPQVQRVVGDQCQYGLRVRAEEELNKKPTGFMTNSKHIAQRVSKRCDGGHSHQSLISGRAKDAEAYPRDLCKEIVKGLKESVSTLVFLAEDEKIWAEEDDAEDQQDVKDALDQEVENAGARLPGRMIPRPERMEEEEESEQEGEEKAEGMKRGVSEGDKRKIQRLHVNLGHPSRDDFVRALRMARAREEVWRYVKNEFKCDVCMAHQRPKSNRPATIPRHYTPGRTVGVDVVYFPGVAPNETLPVLNIVDWGSCYQMLEPLDKVAAEEVWNRFMKSWGRTFGIPEVVVVDQGREFLGAFATRINEAGAVVKTIGARAPHQQGRTERHGGLAKSMFLKMREEMRPDSRQEWETMIHATEGAKNRLYNRSGYSPAQRQIGQNIRIPGSLGSDDPFDAGLVCQGAGGEVQRMLRMREVAMEAFIKQTTMDALKRASRGRPRMRRDFNPGEVVYVYRRMIARKTLQVASDTKRPQWVGPGTVIVNEGPNVWVSMRGEVWKCAKEQVRPATTEEEEAFGLLREELEELREEINRRGSKSLSLPPEEEEPRDEEPEAQRRRVEPESVPPSSTPEEVEGQSQGQSQESSSSSTTEDSTEEPEDEKISEGQMDEAVRSVVGNELLDGTMSKAEENYGPHRRRLEAMRYKPYHFFVHTGEREEEEEEKAPHDVWYYDEERRSLIRIHREPRKGDFIPSSKRGCPIDLGKLKSSWTSFRQYENGGAEVVTGGWRKDQKKERGPPRPWNGFTEFFLKPKVREEEIKWHLLANKNTDEVREESITPEEWPEWRKADAEEWKKVASTDAVRVMMTLDESEEVRTQLRECEREQDITISYRPKMETRRATRRSPISKVKMVREGRSRSRPADFRKVLSHGDYSSDLYCSSSGSNQEISMCSRRSEECLYAVRPSTSKGRKAVL